MPSFSFLTATEILFGRGQAAEAAPRAAALGKRVALLQGAGAQRADWLAAALEAEGCTVTRISIPREPDVPLIEAALAEARGAEVVVSHGGGAVIDAGKAVAALLPAPRPMLDHLEVVGRGLPLDVPPLPFIALPTTAGTGAEVTRNAVIGVPEHRRKVSLRDPRMLPRLAIVDPALTDGLPRPITLASGLDAITQVIEPYICTRANPLTDALCRDAIPKGLAALQVLMAQEDPGARDAMAWVSLCGGLALANAGLGVVHGLAGPLGGLTIAPHGAICGALLPHALTLNRARVTDPALAGRIEEVLGWIGAAFDCPPDQAAAALAEWAGEHGLPGLSGLGVSAEDRAAAAGAAASSSSMKANPAALSEADLRALLDAAG
ncbi:MAG: iron-containing alcohol dehydrogenase [Cereibacter changlensis]